MWVRECGRKKEMEVAKNVVFIHFLRLLFSTLFFVVGLDEAIIMCVCVFFAFTCLSQCMGVQHNKITSKKKKNFEMKEVSAKPTKYLLNSFCFYMHSRFKTRMPCKKVYFRIRNSITVLFFFLLLSCNVFLLSFIMICTATFCRLQNVFIINELTVSCIKCLH